MRSHSYLMAASSSSHKKGLVHQGTHCSGPPTSMQPWRPVGGGARCLLGEEKASRHCVAASCCLTLAFTFRVPWLSAYKELVLDVCIAISWYREMLTSTLLTSSQSEVRMTNKGYFPDYRFALNVIQFGESDLKMKQLFAFNLLNFLWV